MDWSGQFNFVSVTGGTGAGKTTTISTLWKLMGMESDPMSADTTTATLLTTLASTNSIPMWFDEYKPSDMRNDKVNEFHNKLRKTTRGGVGQRSNADLSNEGYPLHAPVIVSGEERIQGSAEERRGIFTSFRKSTTDPDTETARAFAKLSGTAAEDEEDSTRSTYYEGYDYDDHTLAWVRWVTDQDVDELEAMWRAADEYVRDLLSELGIAVPGDLALQGLQTIRYGCMLYRQFYNDIGGEGDVITDEEIDDAINFVVAGSVGGTNQRDHLDVLLDVASRAARAGYLKEDDSYTFVHKGKPNEELRINLATAFDLVKRYAHDHEISEDLLNNKHDYDSRLKDDGENIEWLTARSQNSDPIGRAIGIDTDLAEDIVDGFGRWMWDEDVEGSQPDTWQTLAEAPRGRVNITVEVTDASTDTPDGIAESGVLTDSTNSMDYVVFESDREHIPRLEEGECYAFRGAKLGNHDEAPQIVLDGGVRDCEEVEPGYGHIARPDAGMDTALDAAVADGGGAVQLTESVENAVEENAPAEAGVIAGLVVGRGAADDIEEVKKAISRLESAGRITDFGDGYEPSSGRSGAGQ